MKFFNLNLRPMLLELRVNHEEAGPDSRTRDLEFQIKALLDLAAAWMELAKNPCALEELQDLGVKIQEKNCAYLWEPARSCQSAQLFEPIIRQLWDAQDTKEGVVLERRKKELQNYRN